MIRNCEMRLKFFPLKQSEVKWMHKRFLCEVLFAGWFRMRKSLINYVRLFDVEENGNKKIKNLKIKLGRIVTH